MYFYHMVKSGGTTYLVVSHATKNEASLLIRKAAAMLGDPRVRLMAVMRNVETPVNTPSALWDAFNRRPGTVADALYLSVADEETRRDRRVLSAIKDALRPFPV